MIQRSDLKALASHVTELEAAMEKFIGRAPSFWQDGELASVMGTQMANIKSWIQDARREL